MADLTPVDFDPFARKDDNKGDGTGIRLTPVDHDPFGRPEPKGGAGVGRSLAYGSQGVNVGIAGTFGGPVGLVDWALGAFGADSSPTTAALDATLSPAARELRRRAYSQTENLEPIGGPQNLRRGIDAGVRVAKEVTGIGDPNFRATYDDISQVPPEYRASARAGAGGQGHVVVVHRGAIVHEPGGPAKPGDPPSLKGPMPTGNFVVLAFEHRPATKLDNQGLLGCGPLDDVEIPEPPDASILDQHERIVLAFSGGKDSLATLAVLRPHWSRLIVVHIDTGDLLPETREVVAHAFHMTKGQVQGWRHVRTNSIGWQEKFGMASDVVTHDCTALGMALLHGEAGSRQLSSRSDCCFANLGGPMAETVAELGATLVIRGTRREDSAWGWLEMAGNAVSSDTFADGPACYWMPLANWSTKQVFALLQREGLPIAKYYHGEYRHSGPECARCTAWLNEGRGKYLRQFHPALAGEYLVRLQRVRSAIRPTLAQLDNELDDLTAS